MQSAIVVGSGISGIAAAHRLVERGVKTTILEAEGVVGGRIGTRRHASTEIDLGGRNFTANDRHLLRLLGKLGISELGDYRFNSVAVGRGRHFDMRSGGDPWTRGRRLLANLTSAGPIDLLRLRQVVAGARGDTSGGTIGSPFWARLAEETADPAASSYFGRAVAESVLRPWTLRMMASEPDEVYLGNLGPLLGREPGPMKRVRGGMGDFLRAAQGALEMRVGHRVSAVEVERGRVSGVEGEGPDGRPFREVADIVVVATTAPAAATILPALPSLTRVLRQVAYRPVATVVAEYAHAEFPGDAGGLFLPRGHAVSHIAKYDADHRVRFSFAGVAARQAFAGSSLEDLLAIGEASFRHFGGTLDSRVSFVGNVWYPGLCAHTWMHHRTVQSLEAIAAETCGLVLTGDYWRGNSFEACTIAAVENVDRTLDGLDAQRDGSLHVRPHAFPQMSPS
jgi:oxygen-dependent protoporphyrinogen oxidase